MFARNVSYSFAQYLELEESSRTKHEFFGGEIFAMAGGTPEHAALSMAVGGQLLAQLGGGSCTVFSSDLRIRVEATGLTTYPDVSVVCGTQQHDPQSSTTITNPSLLVVVLSDSTEAYDRGEKFDHYKQISTLSAVVFVSQKTAAIDIWTRRIGRSDWVQKTYASGQVATIVEPACQLEVDAIYRVIDF